MTFRLLTEECGAVRLSGIVTILAAILFLPMAQIHAQQVGGGGGIVSPPPERLLVSPGGVDMRSGEYVYEQTDVSIGEDSEQGGLELTRSMKSDVLGHISPFGNFAHNWEIMITEKMVSVFEGNYTAGSGSDQFMGIHFGGRSESFETNIFGSGYRQVSRNTQARLTAAGAGINAVFTYQGTDGTLAVFRPIGNSECSSFYRCAYVSYIVLPDGTRFDFSYDNPTPGVANATRLRRVTSSRGYALLLEYDAANWNHVSKSCTLNLAVASPPANNICPNNASAAANYSYSGTGAARRLASVIDPLGAMSSFTYTPVANGTFTCPIAFNGSVYGPPASGIQMGFIRPGETTPWQSNSYGERQNNDGLTEDIVYRQDFADASRFEYCYVESPFIEGQIPSIAGGSYANALGERITLEYDFVPMPGRPERVLSNNFLEEIMAGLGVGYGGGPIPPLPPQPIGYTSNGQPVYNTNDLIDFSNELSFWNIQRTLSENELISQDVLGMIEELGIQCCDNQYHITPGPIRVNDALGRVTVTDYCDPNAMANLPPYEHHRCLVWSVPYAVTDPEGVRVQMVWDLQARNLLQSRQIAKPGSGLPDIITSSMYDCTQPINCAKPTSHTDARGNVTNYTYSPVHGGILTEIGPAVDVVSPTGAVTAGVRPQMRNAYIQRTAWISNASGGYVQAATSVWLLASTSSCRTSAATGNPSAPCAATGDEVLTTYDYGPDSGPNNLLLRGQVASADGVALRTCYGYDQRGRRVSETQPNANLTNCP